MASPTFRAKATGGNATAANVTCNVPAGTADEDILLVQLSKDDTAAVTWPSGWNILVEATNNSYYMGIGWKRAASEPANYTWTFTSIWRDIVMLSYQGGVAGENPLDPDVPPTVVQQATGLSVTTGDDTTVTVDTVAVAFADAIAISTWDAAPTNWTARQADAANENHAMDRAFAAAQTITGPTQTWQGSSNPNKGYIVVIQSVTSGGITPATRFRLPAAGSPEVSPATQSYTHTGGVARPLPTTDSSTLATTAITPDAADHLVAGDTYHFQGVSARLAAQVLGSGATAKLAIQALEANAANNLFVQLWIGLYDAAGTLLLATLLAKTADATELATSITNRFLIATTTAGYTCVGGERLVIEISVTGTPTAAGGTQGHNASLRFGASGAGGDNGENDTDTGTTLNPWFEINPGVLFETPAVIPKPVIVRQAVQRASTR